MEIIPAIDLREGNCVRLYQGDYARQTIYSEDPVEVVGVWATLGATRLHVVDLDGARNGIPANLAIVEGIVTSSSVPVQFGGGIRTLEMAIKALAIGVDRVIVSTAAVETPDLVQSMCTELGSGFVVVSVDARDAYAAVRGWIRGSKVLVSDLIREMDDKGVKRFVYTDISRDGTLTEPNFHAIENLVSQTGVRLLVAGGISTVEHLLQLASIGVEGAIVGKALYTDDIDLREALEALDSRIS